ncbi:MAG TPA: hypothetical protein ENH00_01110 [Actinobacteria bacterium]|nr:hypothetical protein BMS3Bbin01_02329 [bacterium BMS3Bbin01]HDH24777.1 hypothetical protein [Actinomycetota bacterium]
MRHRVLIGMVVAGLLAAACTPSSVTSTTAETAAGSRVPVASTPGGAASSTSTSTVTVADRTGSDLVVPEDREGLARQYGLYSPDGEYVGPVDSDGRPLVFEPITGYGDFSDVPYFLLDWQLVNQREVACMQDHGFDLVLDADGLGANWANVPQEQNNLALAVAIACHAGLRLPDRVPRTEEQWAELLAYQIALRDCVASLGHDVPEPPSLDQFIESNGNWTAYDMVPNLVGPAWDELAKTCPQAPVGGFGAWNPGDPVRPYQP